MWASSETIAHKNRTEADREDDSAKLVVAVVDTMLQEAKEELNLLAIVGIDKNIIFI